MSEFLDTNVLVYAVDTRDDEKRTRSLALLAAPNRDFVLSAQVLGEYFVTVTRKLPTPLSAEDAAAGVRALSRRRVVPLDAPLVGLAIDLSRDHQLSYWDALIIEAAVAGGCDTVLSEDLNDGQLIRGVRIVNPFAS